MTSQGKDEETEDKTRYVSCPFCEEEDFDLSGLKYHFEQGYCEVYNMI